MISAQERLVQCLIATAMDDTSLVVLDGDLADSYFLLQFKDRFPSKFLPCGISEQNMVSMAAGMSACGAHPWVFSFGAFLCYRALDQIRVCISQARQSVVLVGSHSGGFSGRNGKTHTALNDLTILSQFEWIDLYCPSDGADIEQVMDHIGRNRDRSAYIRLPRPSLTLATQTINYSPDGELAIVSQGPTKMAVADAVNAMRAFGLNAFHIHSVFGFEDLELAKTLRNKPPLLTVVVSDHRSNNPLFLSLREVLCNHKVIEIAWPPQFEGRTSTQSEILESGPFDPQNILKGVLHELGR